MDITASLGRLALASACLAIPAPVWCATLEQPAESCGLACAPPAATQGSSGSAEKEQRIFPDGPPDSTIFGTGPAAGSQFTQPLFGTPTGDAPQPQLFPAMPARP